MKEILKTFEDFKVASKKPGLEQRDFTDENLNELKQIRDVNPNITSFLRY